MKFIKNDNGKFVLHYKDGSTVLFDYGVDAEEALNSVDENGNHNYTMPQVKKKMMLDNKNIDIEDLIVPKSKSEKEEVDELDEITRIKEQSKKEEKELLEELIKIKEQSKKEKLEK